MSETFRMLGRVAAGAAHDLSNYLGAVDFALTMAERNDGPAQVSRALASAREATQRAMRLTRCLLEYARGGTPAPEPVSLADTVRSVLELFGRCIPDRLTVSVDLEEDLPLVTGVAAELEQLVLNLVLNACEAMPDSGTLTIRVRRAGDGVALLVADTGRGLRHVPVVGDALSQSTKPSRSGSGLGLGIIRGVVSRHAARIQLSSQPEVGTTINIVFPTDEVTARRALGQVLQPVGRDVLVVEDDEETRIIFSELLARAGFTVHTAGHGRAALEWLDAHERSPACIILDLEMPVMNGWEFMKRLRRRPDLPPVVVVSGAVDPPEGAVVYLSKPPSFDRLIRAVQACCADPAEASKGVPAGRG